VRLITFLFLIILIGACTSTQQVTEGKILEKVKPAKEGIKLTVIDGGTMDLNLDFFSTDSSYTGQRKVIKNPVFIIEHPKGRMIWDTGIPDVMVQMSDEDKANLNPVGSLIFDTPVIDQLTKMGLTPDDFDILSLSHTHFDHAGNGNYFVNSTWLVRQEEYDFAFSDNPINHEAKPFYEKLKGAKKQIIAGAHDVFGDGKVVIYPFPGHTPGHSCLYIDFDNRKDVMLTGDLFHFQQQRIYQRMPVFNSDFKQTMESMKAFEEKVKELDAEVIIQHDAEHYKTLPIYPSYWR